MDETAEDQLADARTDVPEIRTDAAVVSAAVREPAYGERLFDILVDSAVDEIALYDSELRLQYVNMAVERRYGIPRADCIGRTHEELDRPSDPTVRASIVAAVRSAFQTCSNSSTELSIDAADEQAVVQLRLVPDVDASGSVKAVCTESRDVTTIVRARDQALETERLLSTTLRSIGDAVIATNSQRKITFMNRVAEDLTGWPESEAIGRDCAEVFHIVNERTRRVVHNPVDKVIASGTIVGLANHTVLLHRDGTERPIADSGAPIRSSDGKLLGVVLVFRDITAQYRADELLRNSEARYHLLTNSMPQIVWTCRPDGGCTYFNEYMERYTGRTVESCLEWGWLDLLPPQTREETERDWRNQVAHNRHMETEIRIRSDAGEYRWHLIRGFALCDGGNNIIEWIGTATDIHDRRLADEERARTATAQRYLADCSTMLSSTLDYEVTLANVAKAAVPELADWCTVHIAQEDGVVRSLATAHVNKAKLNRAYQVSSKFPYNPDDPGGVPKVIRTGTSELYPDILETVLALLADDPERRGIMEELGFRSIMIVPMRARDRVFGAIMFIISESDRKYTERDLAIAEDLGYRAAIALDNARLFRAAQDELAERRRAEEALREKTAQIEILNSRLRRAMNETHHRVKNNLQVISALVDMQVVEHSIAVPTVEIKRISQHTRSLASLHDLLTQQSRTDAVNFVSAQAVVRQLLPILEALLGDRKISTRIDDVRLPVQQTTALAVIINEAITNAAKHASSGDIDVRLSHQGDRLQLSVTDHGPGFPETLDQDNLTSTGLELIRTLTMADLMGDLRLENADHGGARLVVDFAFAEA